MSDALIKIEKQYSDLPWYRKRWFIFTSFLIFIPVTVLILLTGDMYAKRKEGVYVLSKNRKLLLIAICAIVFLGGVLRGVIRAQ